MTFILSSSKCFTSWIFQIGIFKVQVSDLDFACLKILAGWSSKTENLVSAFFSISPSMWGIRSRQLLKRPYWQFLVLFFSGMSSQSFPEEVEPYLKLCTLRALSGSRLPSPWNCLGELFNKHTKKLCFSLLKFSSFLSKHA